MDLRIQSVLLQVNLTAISDPKFSNKFLASYTYIQDTRTSNSDLFPFVDIWQDGDQYMSFGYELFSYNNDVQNKTLSFTDNVTINLDKHTVTAVLLLIIFISAIHISVKEHHITDTLLLMTLLMVPTPSGFGVTYGYNGDDAPGAEATFGLGAVYAQDEWQVIPS